MSDSTASRLIVSSLAKGMPGLSPIMGELLGEAAVVCLEDRGHRSGVTLMLAGLWRDELPVVWQPADGRARRTHADMPEATERGACGLAILIVREVAGMVVVQRSRKGSGFDYWIAAEDTDVLLFEGSSRLEVSGILSGTRRQVATRVRLKRGQMNAADWPAPGYAAVIEFGMPYAQVERA